jgi:hypothetical protein
MLLWTRRRCICTSTVSNEDFEALTPRLRFHWCVGFPYINVAKSSEHLLLRRPTRTRIHPTQSRPQLTLALIPTQRLLSDSHLISNIIAR